ncbi:restriction endonuclease subunit S [Candidatus Binatia bacterium]|nr:restriction endonuclease subunit S [Candidatus Binatia bacterium]
MSALRRFRPYPAYKDSRVEWLGEIPAHWECLALARVTESRCDGPFGSALKSEHYSYGGVRVVRLQNIGEGRFDGADAVFINEAYAKGLGDHSVRAGDLLIAGLGDEGHPVGRACVAPQGIEPAMVKADCFRFRLKSGGAMSAFVSLQLSATAHAAAVLATGATRSRMNLTAMAARKVALPPLPERRAIAAFVERETARIDALLAKKERLIELLQEKRTALINRAVTKGLDPTVPMKDSGVEWLGEIPAHWEVKPLKHVADFINGFAFKPDEWIVEGTPIIRIENLNGGENFNFTDRVLPAKYWADEGTLLFGWSGNRGTSFGPFIWWRPGRHYVNQHIFRVVDFECDSLWLYWMLRAVTFYVEKQAHGIIGMVHITRGELGSIPVPQVPRREQEQIAAHLNLQHERLDALTAKVRDAIDHLKELRTALISAAVTGKIDVREEVA